MLAPARLDWSRGASTGDLARWRLTRALSRGKPRPRRGVQVSGDAAKKVESSEERGTIKVPGKLVGKRSSAGHSSLLGDKPIRADKFGSPSLHFFSKAYVKSRKRQLSFFNAYYFKECREGEDLFAASFGGEGRAREFLPECYENGARKPRPRLMRVAPGGCTNAVTKCGGQLPSPERSSSYCRSIIISGTPLCIYHSSFVIDKYREGFSQPHIFTQGPPVKRWQMPKGP